MQSNKPKLYVFPKYTAKGPSSRLRFYQFQDVLSEEFELEFYPLLGDWYIEDLFNKRPVQKCKVIKSYIFRIYKLLILKKGEKIWLEKEALPYIPAVLEFFLKAKGVKIITDYDDAVFHIYDLHRNPIVRLMLGRKIDHVMFLSDVVCAGNSYLALRAQQAGAKIIEIIPTVVDEKKYHREFIPQNEIPIIGWIGSPVTEKYLYPVIKILEELSTKNKFKLSLIGASQNMKLHNWIDIIKWSEQTEVDELNKIYVGIMPLVDSPFERGKCGYKLIQYMACGKAVIASTVGANIQIVSDNGFLVSSKDEWKNAIEKLLNDRHMLSYQKKKSKEIFLKYYSKKTIIPKFKKIFEAIR